ncbi:tripartite tricarboxylate transporter substrate-binding protein [Xylophilus sp. GW821-FHT01B05]
MDRRKFISAAAAGAMGAPAYVRAQDKVVRIIVPFATGGSGDLIPRLIAPKLSEFLKQPVIVDNRAGAGGKVGAVLVSRAEPDGFTLGVATVSTHGIQPAVSEKPPYDPVAGFAQIGNIAMVPNVVSVNSGIHAKSVAEFVKLANSTEGGLTYASPGVGSLGHMMGELFRQSTKANLRHVPYRGAGPALQDVMGGVVDMLCDNFPASLPQIRSGRLYPLAVAWKGRLSQSPETPTFDEVGIHDLNDPAWFGLVAPPGVAQSRVAQLHEGLVYALRDPNVEARIKELGAVPSGNTPKEFRDQIRAELEKWKKVAKAGNISLEA